MKEARFIAGAVCPGCGAMDKLVVDEASRRCVSCGFTDARPATVAGIDRPPATPPTDASVVRIVESD